MVGRLGWIIILFCLYRVNSPVTSPGLHANRHEIVTVRPITSLIHQGFLRRPIGAIRVGRKKRRKGEGGRGKKAIGKGDWWFSGKLGNPSRV